MTVQEAAEKLEVSASLVYQLVDDGRRIPQRHVGQLSMAQVAICQKLKSFLRISIRTWLMDQNPCETSHFLAIGVLTQRRSMKVPSDRLAWATRQNRDLLPPDRPTEQIDGCDVIWAWDPLELH